MHWSTVACNVQVRPSAWVLPSLIIPTPATSSNLCSLGLCVLYSQCNIVATAAVDSTPAACDYEFKKADILLLALSRSRACWICGLSRKRTAFASAVWLEPK